MGDDTGKPWMISPPFQLSYKPASPDVASDVTAAELREWVEEIARPRHFVEEAASNRAIGDLVSSAFVAAGYEVSFQGPHRNVVARLPSGTERPVLLVGAHYDSVPGCPGADDNASAVAVLLAAAGSLARTGRHRDVVFVAFNAEEDGLLGSEELVAGLASRPAAAHVLEMVGFTSSRQRAPDGLPVTLPPQGDFLALVANDRSHDLLRETVDLPAGMALLAVQAGEGVETVIADLLRSDHAPFWRAGIPALMWTDTAEYRNPNYHLPSDTPDTLDYAFMAHVATLLVDAVAAWSRRTSG
jgi:Zn-dependent M28 family amino/carboxypeptidase